LKSGKYFVLFCLILAIYYSATLIVYPGFSIHLGSVNSPTPDLVSLWNWWQAWSWILIASLTFAILSADNITATADANRILARIPITSAIFLISLVLSLTVRFYLVNSMYLTDDESAYLFAARLVGGGQLFTDSPEQKIFYDRVFMINDGQFFPQYFYGWPFLLSLGIVLNVPFLVNPLFFAGSCVLIYKILSHRSVSYWGVVGVALFALSPLGIMNSANYLTHSSATFFTLFLAFSYEQIRKSSNSTSLYIAIASAAAGILFNIRPMTGVLISLPYFVATLVILVKQKAVLNYAMVLLIPGLALLSGFFLLNYVLHDSPLNSGYSHYISYAMENNFRFSWWNFSAEPLEASEVPFFPAFDGRSFVVSAYAGWLRLTHDGLGLPGIVLPSVAILWALRYNAPMAFAVLLMVLGHARWYDNGIDSYGPVHLSEALPLVGIILVLFVQAIQTWFQKNMPDKTETLSRVTKALGVAAVASIFLGYSLIRFSHVATMARNIAIPYNEAELLGITNAIVFSPVPFIDQRSISPLSHYRYWRDNPLPDLSDNIIWVNDLGEAENRMFLNSKPSRKGYTMVWVEDGRKVEFQEIQIGRN